MKICISKRSNNYNWIKSCEDITYTISKIIKRNNSDKNNVKHYNMLSFNFEFSEKEDKTFFCYSYPYNFSLLQDFIAS